MRIDYKFLLSTVAAGLVCTALPNASYAGLEINPYPNREKTVNVAPFSQKNVVEPEVSKASEKVFINPMPETSSQTSLVPEMLIPLAEADKEIQAHTSQFAKEKAEQPKLSVSSKFLDKPDLQASDEPVSLTATKTYDVRYNQPILKVVNPTPEQIAKGGVVYRPMSVTPQPEKTFEKVSALQMSTPDTQIFSAEDKEALKAELREELRQEFKAELASKNKQDGIATTTSASPEAISFVEREVINPVHRLMKNLTSSNAVEPTVSKSEVAPHEISPAAGSSQIDQATLQQRGLVAIQVPNKGVSPQSQASIVGKTAAAGWMVVQGEDLRDTLGRWSQQAGVEMIWSVPFAFDVPQTSSINGSYEQAVQALLEQYSLTNERPLGSLHVDPQTGRRTLVIEAQG